MGQFIKECLWSVEDWYLTYYGRGVAPAVRFFLEMLMLSMAVFVFSWLCSIE